nr:zinc finger, CCHC-type [Tanacetum cinerariifolium]
MNMDEAIQVSCIIDKLLPSWKDFKHTLKYQKEEFTLVKLGCCLCIEESLRVQDNDKPKGNNIVGPSVVNIMEHNNSFMYNDNKGKRKHHDTKVDPNKKAKVTCWKCEKPRHLKKDCKGGKVGNKANGSGTNVLVDGSTNSLKGRSKKGIGCIFVGYVEHSKAFRFYVIKSNDTVAINLIIESMDAIFDENRFSSIPITNLSIPNKTEDISGLVVPEEDVAFWKEAINDEMDSNIEEVYMNQPQGFIMPVNENNVCKLIRSLYGLKQAPKQCKFDKTGKAVIICLYTNDMLIFGTDQVQVDLTKEFLSSRFSMKDIGEANILVNTPMETSKKLMPNNGQAVSQLEYSRVIGFLMYAMTCTRPDIAFAMGKLSRHLGVRHIMIRELIMNGVVSIEFVRSQQNLADHLSKRLAKDLVLKSAERMGLKSNQVVEC